MGDHPAVSLPSMSGFLRHVATASCNRDVLQGGQDELDDFRWKPTGLDQTRGNGDSKRWRLQGKGGARQVRSNLPQNSSMLRLLDPRQSYSRKGRALLRVCEK